MHNLKYETLCIIIWIVIFLNGDSKRKIYFGYWFILIISIKNKFDYK